ncbi:MAG: hypothetical protein ACLS6G_11475 [Christensenellales bacterium]
MLQRGNGFVDAVRQRARPILAQRVDQLAENPRDMLVLGQISRPARVRQPDEDDAYLLAARAADEALAFSVVSSLFIWL